PHDLFRSNLRGSTMTAGENPRGKTGWHGDHRENECRVPIDCQDQFIRLHRKRQISGRQAVDLRQIESDSRYNGPADRRGKLPQVLLPFRRSDLRLSWNHAIRMKLSSFRFDHIHASNQLRVWGMSQPLSIPISVVHAIAERNLKDQERTSYLGIEVVLEVV